MSNTNKLSGNTDATEWVKLWMAVIKDYPDIPHDEGAMLGWFANAIEAGRDAGYSAGFDSGYDQAEALAPYYDHNDVVGN